MTECEIESLKKSLRSLTIIDEIGGNNPLGLHAANALESQAETIRMLRNLLMLRGCHDFFCEESNKKCHACVVHTSKFANWKNHSQE